MKKKLLSLLIGACSLTLGLGAFAACDGGAGSGPSLQYSLEGNGYTVVGIGTYEDGELIIPATYKGKPVTAIAAQAFSGNKEIGLLQIPDSVTVIGDKAFSGCSRLEAVTMGDGVVSIGKEAFANCDQMKTINFSDSLTTIEEKAFYYCRKLQNISFPDTLEVIGASAFAGDVERVVYNALKTVDFGTGLRSIGEKAFYNCAWLEEVVIPDGAPTVIAKNAFLNCSGLKKLDLGDDVVSIGESAFSLDDEGQGLKLREAIIGNGVTTIGAKAFSGSRKMATITLGESVQYIGDDAFKNCRVLWEVINNSPLPIIAGTTGSYGNIAENARYVHTSDEQSRISHDAEGLVYYTHGTSKILISVILDDSTTIVIPDDVTEVAEYACYNEQYLTGVVVGDGCTKIGMKAFGNCYNLRTLDLSGASLTTIGKDAFYHNASVYSVILSASVKEVGTGAFRKKELDGYRAYRVYYMGTPEQWAAIKWGDNNLNWFEEKDAKYGFYSEQQPTDKTRLYWRYVNGYAKYWE